MNIRKATVKDSKCIQALNAKLFKHDYKYDKTLDLKYPFSKKGVAYYRKAITSSKHLTLIYEDESGKALGYIIGLIRGVSEYRKNVKVAVLDNIFVEQKYRRDRVATALVGELKKWAKSNKASYMRVNAYSKNKNAIKFYESTGFRNSDTILEQKI